VFQKDAKMIGVRQYFLRTFYLKFDVEPLDTNDQHDLVRIATAYCWIIAKSADDAHRKAVFHIKKDEWRIVDNISHAEEVSREDFADRDIGLKAYDNAQRDGNAIVYAAVARDGKTEMGPIELKTKMSIDISSFLEERKRNRLRGRCFHYTAGDNCSNYSMAHSIQKGKLLSEIARDGHVFGLSHYFGTKKKNRGRLSYKRIGINEISTFRGFCNKHDKELFRPIDDHALIPTNEQAILYGYRSLCRELFVKENAMNLVVSELEEVELPAVRNMLIGMAKGTYIGLRELQTHKNYFDETLNKSQFEDVRYVLFKTTNKPNIVFSGIIYPDYDFLGNQLQDLGDPNSRLGLITYCSAWIEHGWGFLFAWHSTSSTVCESFIDSLKKAAKQKGNYQDYLFKLAVGCGNHAISPEWWEGLPNESKNAMIERISDIVDVLADVESSYLSMGLEGISDWKFNEVVSNIGIHESL
jgi:hypothetical protein